jgi:hypothetical protein
MKAMAIEEPNVLERITRFTIRRSCSEVLKHMGELLERVLENSTLATTLMNEPQFVKLHNASLEYGGVNGSAMQTDKDTCNGPIPDIGKVNGLYGSELKSKRIAELITEIEAAKKTRNVNKGVLASCS